MSIKLGIPRLGIYSNVLRSFLEELGIEVIMPAKITRDMIKLGVANSADMVCYPFKTTLGQEIWALENGATDLLSFNSCGLCRLKHYHQIQEHILRNLGYQFTMNVITKHNFKKDIKRLLNISFLEAHRLFKKVYPQLQELEEATYRFLPERDLKIGIVGEVYSCWERDTNFDIVRKLQRRGVNVNMSITVTDYLRQNTHRGKDEEKEARELLTQELGGHGFESICNTIYYGKNGFDGVIHLLPLSCMPESTVEPLVDFIAEKYRIPLYRFPLDEATFEVGFNTRLDTFISMLRRRKR
ncbi:MAG: hypothetical protein Q7J06_06160 [Bacteroidales bacterium]|nr:hypothetical protein [Bacteroidales bacterium]